MEQAGHRTKTRKGGNDPAFAPQTALARTLFVLVVPALSISSARQQVLSRI